MKLDTTAFRISQLKPLLTAAPVNTVLVMLHVDVPLAMPAAKLSSCVGPIVELETLTAPLTGVPVLKSPISRPASPAPPAVAVMYELASANPFTFVTLIPSVPLLRTYIRVSETLSALLMEMPDPVLAWM